MNPNRLSPPSPTCLEDLQFCNDCPFVPPERDDLCPVLENKLADSRQLEELRQESNQHLTDKLQLRFDNDKLQRRIESLRRDRLLGIYSPQGMTDRIANDRDLVQELQQGNWGILYLDVRFLKYFNDEVGRDAGDNYLRTVRDTVVSLAKQSFRTHPGTQPEVERRQSESDAEDILWRVGGDEIALLVRNVGPAQLEAMRHRLSEPLSVANGISLGQQGHTPIVASVTWCHASVVMAEDMQTYLEGSRHPVPVLDKLLLKADADHEAHKHEQYDEMWQYYLNTHRPMFRPFIRRPADDRAVASLFIQQIYNQAQTD